MSSSTLFTGLLKTRAVRQVFASKNQLFKHLRVEGSACGVAAGTFAPTPLSNKTEKVEQQLPQGVLVCGHAGLVVHTFSEGADILALLRPAGYC